MVFDYLSPSDTREIQNAIVTFLEANLIDPYEQVTEKDRKSLVHGDDFELRSIITAPYIHVSIGSFMPVKVTAQKTGYLEEEEHNFMIYFSNGKDQAFTFADTGLKLTNEAQCMKYLQYIRTTLKDNLSDSTFTFSKPRFGTIAKPIYNPKTKLYVSALPFTVYTYRR